MFVRTCLKLEPVYFSTAMKNISWLKAVKMTANEYFQNTSLTGFKLLFFLDKSRLLQMIWIPFLLTGVMAAVFITGHCILFYELNPTVTYINSFQRPVAMVPFPAVSICSINKISDLALKEYVNDIYRYNQTWSRILKKEALLEKIYLFGGFYDHDGFDVDEAYELQTYLDKFNSMTSRFYNTTDILRKLAPKCEHLLQKCSWKGKTYPCAELFVTLPTPEGFCCIFNYNRPGQNIRKPSVKYLNSIGEDLGLKVLLNTTMKDYFFSERSTTGFIIQIFNSLFFPDILTGKLSQFPVSPNTDILAPLTMTTLTTEDEVRNYKIGQRRCYFANELPKQYGAHYSQPECFLKCKLRSIQSLCNCIPFYTPNDFIHQNSLMYCNLSHLKCLSRYKLTWTSYRPNKRVIGLEQEIEVALKCYNCIPLCNTNEYEYQLDKAAFNVDNNHSHFDEFLKNETDLADTSLLRIFYHTPYAMQYKKRRVYTPNGLFGNVGGILSISIGCSLISIIEFFYFATVKFYINLKRIRMVDSAEKTHEQD